MADGEPPLRVDAATRRSRWFTAGFALFLLGYAPFTVLADGAWWHVAVAVLLLLGHLPLVALSFSYLEVNEHGLRLDHRIRTHEIPWADIASIHLDDGIGSPVRPFEVELVDGSTVSSGALAALARPKREPERRALLARLEREEAAHAFSLR